MAELINTYNEKDLLLYFQHLRLETSLEINNRNIEKTKPCSTEKNNASQIFHNFTNSIKQKVHQYDKKSAQIISDLAQFNTVNHNLITRADAIRLSNTLFDDETQGMSKLLFAAMVIYDSNYNYQYLDEGLNEVSNILFNNESELLIIKKQLEDNYKAVNPKTLSTTQKRILMGTVAVSLASVICLPILLGGGAAVSASATTAALAAHGFGDMQIGLGVIALESLLLGAVLTGVAYGGMKLYNSKKVKDEFKKMSAENNAFYLAIQATHIQRLSKTMNKEALKEHLDTILRNLNLLKSDLDYFLFIERDSIDENKKKINSFHEFDKRLIRLLGL